MALTVGELQVILEAQTRNFQTGLDAAGKKAQSFEREATGAFNRVGAGFATAIGAIGGIIAGISFQRLVSGLLDVADAAQRARQTLLVATGSAEDADVVFGALAAVASNTRQSITDTVDVFDKLEQSTQNLGLSQRDLVDLTEVLNNTLLLSGKTGGEASRALNTFSASIARGQVDIGAFSTALKQVPELSDAIASGLGITQKEMLKLAAAGNLTAEQVVAALQRVAPAVAQQASQLAPTFGQALTEVRNQILLVVDAFTNGAGISASFGAAIADLSEGLASNLVRGARSAINAFASILDIGAEVLRFLEDLGVSATNVALTFGILKNGADIFVIGLKNGFAVLRVAAQSLVVAFNSVRLALGLIDIAEFDASAQRLVEANAEMVSSSQQAGKAISGELTDSLNKVKAIFASKTDTQLSTSLKGFADDARKAADDAVAAVDRIQGARGQLSTVPRGEVVPTQTKEQQAEEAAFFKILEQRRVQQARFDEEDRKERERKRIAEEKRVAQNIRRFGDDVGDAVSEGLNRGLQSGNFFQTFSQSLADAAAQGLQESFSESISDLASGLTAALAQISPAISKLFGGGGTGSSVLGQLGGALGSGLLSFGGALLSSALRDDEISSSAGNIRSAVTSTQQVRGVVAGPTSIAVADVARGISDAFLESERLLGLIERNTRIAAARAGGSVADPSVALLTTQSEALI